ncbi:MAG: polysaccharide deacetylase family protein [Oscillospiraceae bacterium]|nr:polysaccharide deacetylase family protein [Oscillospiraceae bacterium]
MPSKKRPKNTETHVEKDPGSTLTDEEISASVVARLAELEKSPNNNHSHQIIIACVMTLVVVLLAVFAFADPLDIFGDFGILTTNAPPDDDSVHIPILLYRHFADEGLVGTTISGELFGRQLRALRDAGYNAISFQQLRDFVFDGGALPERPIIITIDGAYMSVYETAFPLLEQYEMKATVFMIGATDGMDASDDSQHLALPRFGGVEAVGMEASGFIFIESHFHSAAGADNMETEETQAPNIVTRGDADSLAGMRRLSISGDVSPEALLDMVRRSH